MTIPSQPLISDPWNAPSVTASSTDSAKSTPLSESSAFPMLLLACFAFLMLKASFQLLCFGIASGIFVYRRLRKLAQRSHANIAKAPISESLTSSANPTLAMT